MSSRGRVRRPSFLRRTLVFILAMLLGMALLVGAVAGGIYAALAMISLDTLESVGIGVGDGLLTEDSLLRELSVLGLIGELASVSGRLSTLTINTLAAEYGVILSEETRALIPEALFDLPLSDLTGPNSLGVILQNVTVGDIWTGGEQSLPPRAWEQLAPRPLIHAVLGEYNILFDGLYLGDFTGVALSVAPDGTATPIFAEGEQESLAAYLGTVNLGKYFSVEDGNAVIQESLDRTPLDSFVEAEEGNAIAGALKKKMLGDLLKLGQNGITFSADNLMEDLYLGDTLSYEKGEDGVWYDADGKEATGVFRELAGLPLNDLTGDAVMNAVDSVYLLELMDYERIETEDGHGNTVYTFVKKNEHGVSEPPKGMIAEFADMTVGQLRTDGQLDKTVKDMQIGVAMGYTLKNGIWYDEQDAAATGAFRPFLGKTIGNLSSEMNTIYLGQIMGFDPVYEGGSTTPTAFYKDENGNGVYDADVDTAPGPLMDAFVTMTLEEIEDEDAFSSRVQKIRIGDAMGFTLDGETWEHKDGSPVTGMFRTLAGKRVEELEDAVKEVSVADALGYEYKDGKWVSTDGKDTEPPGILRVLMTSTLTSLSGDAGNVYVGEIMGYEKYDRDPDPDKEDIGFRRPNPDKKNESDPAYLYPAGAVAEFVGMKVSELENEETITNKINGMKVGTAMSYTPVYDKDGNITSWLDKDNTPVTNSLLKAVIDKTVGDMGSVLNEMTLGEAMGYTPDGKGGWIKGDGVTKETNAFILSIIDERIGDMSAVMDDLTVGEVMGYTFVRNCPENGEGCETEGDCFLHGTWSDPDANDGKIGGYVQIIGPSTRLKDLKDTLSDLDNVTIGKLMGAGLLTLDGYEDKLKYIFGEGESWKELSINDFINEMLNKVPGP